MNNTKKIVAVICAVCCCFFASCSCSSDINDSGLTETANVWAAYGTEKILYENDYSTRYGDNSLKIFAFKNEYEAAQIVISGNVDSKYTITVGELKTTDGKVLPSESVSLYHEKLMYLERITDKGVNTPPGYYPDPLLPYDTAVEYDENCIEKDRNTAIWVQVHTESTQGAGLYKGNINVKVGSKSYNIPTSIEIYDYALSDQTHVKSMFMVNYDWISYAELNSTKELADAYYDYFLEHRVMPADFPTALNGGYTAYPNDDSFLDDLVKAAKDPRCSAYRIPTIANTAVLNYTNEYGEETSLSVASLYKDVYYRFIKEIANRSVTENLNLFEKAYTYMTICDEYDDIGKPNGWIYAKYNHNRIKEFHTDLAQWVLDNLENTNPDLTDEEFQVLKVEISNGILGIRNILTGVSIDPILNSPYPGDAPTVTFCPTIETYSTQGTRDRYAEYASQSQGEVWSYTAINPQSPYPNYHMESDLLSPRLLNWMMYDYNIDGNLFWSTTGYYNFGQTVDFQVQDYYYSALRYPGMNGDGFLVYPGRQYGIEGPVSSLRMESILDGNEDYDLLYELEDFYLKAGCSSTDFDSIYKYIAMSLYNGTQCNFTDNDDTVFAASRKLLADLLVMTSNTGSVLKNINIDKNVVKVEVVAPAGVSVSINDTTVTETDFNGNVLYTFTFNLVNKQSFVLSVVKDSSTYTVSLDLGSPATFVVGDELNGKINAYKSTVSVETKIENVDGQSAMIVSVQDVNGKPSFEIDFTSFVIDDKFGRITLNVYSYGADVSYSLVGKCKNHLAFTSLSSGTFNEGWNEIVIDLSMLNCVQNGIVTSLRFVLSGEDNAVITDAVNVALGQIVLEG